MASQHDCALDASPAMPCETPDARATHPCGLGEDSPPRDWSQIGRRVLAEAWRRITDDLAARHASGPETIVARPGAEDAK